MRPFDRQTIGSAVAVAALSALLIWGGQSLPTSHASSTTATPVPVAMTAPPSNGFTEVAKAVTPAVVNITTVAVEKVSDTGAYPMNCVNEWRSSLESGVDRPVLVDSMGRKVLVSHGSIGAAGWGLASSYHQMGTS